MTYYDEDEQSIKKELVRLDEEYDLGQDAAVELLEDLTVQLKTQELKLPSLKNALEEGEA